MNIQFKIRGLKEIKKIYCRIYDGRRIDISVPTNLSVHQDNWKNSKPTDLVLEKRLLKLQLAILSDFNDAFSSGDIITADWLKNSISKAFDRPKHENITKDNSHTVYFSSFCSWWLDNHAENWKVSAKKYISKVQISQYRKFSDHFMDFEKSIGRKLVLKDFSQDDIYELANWYEGRDYNTSTIEREIGRFKFFCNRAFENDIKVSKVRNQRIYIDKEDDEIEAVYLNEQEINKIYNLEIDDYELDNVRDNLLLSCWIGLRLNDFMTNLKTDNIKDGYISIKTQKTGSFVKLPIHPMVKSILDKRFGQLPKKIDFSEYNKQIKVVCMLAKIDNQVYGKLWNPEKKRKENVYAPKYKFISSHIGRKSMATNLSGKVSDEVIMSAIGWSNLSMKQHYDKTSKTEYANQLQDYWTKNN